MIFSNISQPRIRGVVTAIWQLGALAFCGAVSAADLPTEKAPVFAPPPPAFSWTGLYAGVNGGIALDHYAFVYQYFPTSVPGGGGSNGITSTGPVIGGQVGYNYELSDQSISGLSFLNHAVIGIEADSDWGDVKGWTNVSAAGRTLHIGTDFENFGTLRLRLGYSFDRLLVYLTGGLSYATVDNYYNVAGVSVSRTQTHAGVFPNFGVVGIGAEYAITDHFSVKAEYLYDFNGARWDQLNSPTTGIVGFGTRAMYHIARLGLNYKFESFGARRSIQNIE
ncbi:MAG TPA: outer membrane beta-barrel protein [Methylovirgula sp.]